jgi:tryptophanyl-tRNA synthetase
VDQAPHVEITREIARRFNYLYGPVFPEPEVILTETPKLLGTDRRKMSKSYGNAIFLSDPPETVAAKVGAMITDPQRMRKSDPGNPDVCNVYDFHKLYSPPEVTADVNRRCRTADIGCVECKKLMAGHLNAFLDPIRERRRFYLERPGLVEEIITAGSDKARQTARRTLEEVRAAVKL